MHMGTLPFIKQPIAVEGAPLGIPNVYSSPAFNLEMEFLPKWFHCLLNL
jgi:hypothetical protein